MVDLRVCPNPLLFDESGLFDFFGAGVGLDSFYGCTCDIALVSNSNPSKPPFEAGIASPVGKSKPKLSSTFAYFGVGFSPFTTFLRPDYGPDYSNRALSSLLRSWFSRS